MKNAITPMRLIVLLGIVSLFSDMTYEAARSMYGPFLGFLGAGAPAIGAIAGVGELIGYGLRFFSGIVSDRTRKYWAITIFGYAVNLLAVPALALAGRWETAAVLLIMERFGKAIRVPPRDAILSHAASSVGRGWGFAVHEALDQTGAILGPLIVAAVFAWKGSYAWTFGLLLIPAVLALIVLLVSQKIYPEPANLETSVKTADGDGFSKSFWIYTGAVSLIAAGFADYPLIAYHMASKGIIEEQMIPLIYAGAMGVDALSALFFGRLYDRKGLPALMIAVGISSFFAPLAFSANGGLILAGMVLWGIGMGAIESVVRAVVADMVPQNRRGTGYGIFNGGFGLAWFAGSALMGFLYDFSLTALIVFSVASQLASLPVLFMAHRQSSRP
jgi:MFS family permease